MGKSYKDYGFELPKNQELWKKTRKKGVKRPQTFRDKKNNYQRRDKWDDSQFQ